MVEDNDSGRIVEDNERPNLLKIISVSIIIVALIVWGIYWYAAYNSLSGKPTENNTQNMSLAYNYGIYETINQIVNATNDCKIVAVNYNNGTRQLVDVDCVRRMLNITGG